MVSDTPSHRVSSNPSLFAFKVMIGKWARCAKLQLHRETTCEDAGTDVGIQKSDDGDADALQDTYVIGQVHLSGRSVSGRNRKASV